MISGILLSGASSEAADEPGENPAARIFKAGRTVTFTYSILNARMDAEKRPRLEVRVHVFREGQEIYAGDPVTVSPGADTDPAIRTRAGNLLLHATARPGRYTLEITVTDSAAAPQRTATQSIDFEVR